MTRIVNIQNRIIRLDPAQLIQSGGEGMVFKVGTTAVKLYHHPNHQQQEKLEFFLQSGLANQLRPEICAPNAFVTDQQGKFLGFQMPLLPSDAVPIKYLAKAAFWRKYNLTTTAVISLFQQLHTTLSTLHALGIIIGDLNDQNIFITLQSDNSATQPLHHLSPLLIDVDSYQFGRFPCPVAMDLFVDPNLYGISDLSKRPFFSPATDWYAFFVLLVRSLLHIHPYGGVHHQQKSIAARASAGLSILNPTITYPPTARPRETLPDNLIQHMRRIFDLHERVPFIIDLLNDYANHLALCNKCHHQYPQERTNCPFCDCKQSVKVISNKSHHPTHIYTTTEGFINSIHILPNSRFLAIIFAQNQYKLVRFGLGGIIDEMVLFNGRSGYQFAACQNILVVSPPDSKQLLMLDINSCPPRKLNMLETATFREMPVFSASPNHFYRIAGTWIMRGTMQNGHFIEEPTVTSHHNQTWFQASPLTNTITGYHRIFAENRFFLWHEGQSYDIPIPPLQDGESLVETAVTFLPNIVIFSLKINQRGKIKTVVYHISHQGKIQQTHQGKNLATHQSTTYQLPQGSLHFSPTEIWFQA